LISPKKITWGVRRHLLTQSLRILEVLIERISSLILKVIKISLLSYLN